MLLSAQIRGVRDECGTRKRSLRRVQERDRRLHAILKTSFLYLTLLPLNVVIGDEVCDNGSGIYDLHEKTVMPRQAEALLAHSRWTVRSPSLVKPEETESCGKDQLDQCNNAFHVCVEQPRHSTSDKALLQQYCFKQTKMGKVDGCEQCFSHGRSSEPACQEMAGDYMTGDGNLIFLTTMGDRLAGFTSRGNLVHGFVSRNLDKVEKYTCGGHLQFAQDDGAGDFGFTYAPETAQIHWSNGVTWDKIAG